MQTVQQRRTLSPVFFPRKSCKASGTSCRRQFLAQNCPELFKHTFGNFQTKCFIAYCKPQTHAGACFFSLERPCKASVTSLSHECFVQQRTERSNGTFRLLLTKCCIADCTLQTANASTRGGFTVYSLIYYYYLNLLYHYQSQIMMLPSLLPLLSNHYY